MRYLIRLSIVALYLILILPTVSILGFVFLGLFGEVMLSKDIPNGSCVEKGLIFYINNIIISLVFILGILGILPGTKDDDL